MTAPHTPPPKPRLFGRGGTGTIILNIIAIVGLVWGVQKLFSSMASSASQGMAEIKAKNNRYNAEGSTDTTAAGICAEQIEARVYKADVSLFSGNLSRVGETEIYAVEFTNRTGSHAFQAWCIFQSDGTLADVRIERKD